MGAAGIRLNLTQRASSKKNAAAEGGWCGVKELNQKNGEMDLVRGKNGKKLDPTLSSGK
jgi:hypothetical protein